MPLTLVLYFSFFKYTDQPNMVALAWPLVWVWDGTICCSKRSGNLLEYGDNDLSRIYFCLLGERNTPTVPSKLFFAVLYFAKSRSFPEVCHCQQYGGNSLSGHDGNITWPSQVLEWLLLEKRNCFLFVLSLVPPSPSSPSRTAVQLRCHLC